MPAVEKTSNSEVLELSSMAMEAFCEDISGMLDLSMECTELPAGEHNIKSLRRHFKKFVAINLVESQGAMNRTFGLIFDGAGLFILAGEMVMQPANKIEDNVKKGTLEDTEGIADAAKEVGNLLVGSWERVFHAELEGHGHFHHAGTSIVSDWGVLADGMGLKDTDNCRLLSYEITVNKYPPFICGVVFPGDISVQQVVEDSPAEAVEEKPVEKVEPADEKTADRDKPIDEEDFAENEPAEDEPVVKSESAEEEPADTEKTTDTDKAADTDKLAETEETVDTKEPVDTDKTDDENQRAADSLKSNTEPEQSQGQNLAENEPVIKKVDDNRSSAAESPKPVPLVQAVAIAGPAAAANVPSNLTAERIMNTSVVWISPQRSVDEALRKMQASDIGYLLAGEDGQLEGIVSRSNLSSAVSPFLQNRFAQFRRQLDEDSLKIRIKWVMTKPVHTITPGTPVPVVMARMSQFSIRCLVVVGEDERVLGVITVFDIFKALMNDHWNIPMV